MTQRLPFTGLSVLLVLLLGCAGLTGGLALRRLTAAAGARTDPAGNAAPVATRPGSPSPR